MAETERQVEVAWAKSAKTVPGGIAVAALMGGMLGMLALAVVNVFTAASKPFNAGVHGVETISLVVWLGSWVLLHYALRDRDMKLSAWLIVFLVGVGVATTLIWPPVFEYLAGH